MAKHNIAIAGAGFAGAVLARELAESGRYRVEVFEARDHVAGNCHTVRDPATGVLLHQYGAHIFHTDREDVWKYVQRFSAFGPYTNRVKAVTDKGVYSMPINLLTINQFFKKTFTPKEAEAFVASLADRTIRDPQTFEEQALAMIGRDLYEAFFKGYTIKQWGQHPRELPASILKRLPVRFNYDDNYYASRYQGTPIDGYTALIERMLDHEAIVVHRKTPFERAMAADYAHVFFSGPIDAFFAHDEGRLRYRTLDFERHDATGDVQGNAVINYCSVETPYTRILEHKHLHPWEKVEKTVLFRERARAAEPGEIPFYPLRLDPDKKILARYVAKAEATPDVTFLGRMGTYRYLDMHVVVAESLDLAKACRDRPQHAWPKWSGMPL